MLVLTVELRGSSALPPVGGDPFNRQPVGSTPGSGFGNQTQPAINQPAKSNTGAIKPSQSRLF